MFVDYDFLSYQSPLSLYNRDALQLINSSYQVFNTCAQHVPKSSKVKN